MLYMSCVLVVVVRSILRVQTRPLIAASWLTLILPRTILLHALESREINVSELSIGTQAVPVLFLFSAVPTHQTYYNQSA